jgi:hypothetical protein
MRRSAPLDVAGPHSRAHLRPALAALAAVMLLATATGSCGGSGGSSPSATATVPSTAPPVSPSSSAPSDPLAGTWGFTNADLTLDAANGNPVQVNDGSGLGGIVVEGTAPNYTVTVVDKTGARTDPLPAVLKAGIARFAIPLGDGTMPTAFTAKGDGLVIQFGDEETQWQLVRATTVPTQSPGP